MCLLSALQTTVLAYGPKMVQVHAPLCLGLLLGTEAPVTTPNGIYFSFLSLLHCAALTPLQFDKWTALL